MHTKEFLIGSHLCIGSIVSGKIFKGILGSAKAFCRDVKRVPFCVKMVD